jgi:hypothetical protein
VDSWIEEPLALDYRELRFARDNFQEPIVQLCSIECMYNEDYFDLEYFTVLIRENYVKFMKQFFDSIAIN